MPIFLTGTVVSDRALRLHAVVMEVRGGREGSTSARAERRLEEGTGEEEQGTWASRCFNFWVLARKGQLRAALNEAGSHPINCLVR